MDDPARGVDDAIRKAMEEGQFNNLPGAGKPLRFEDHPYEDPGWSLAFHMLKVNEFTLPWIADRKEIEAELEAARQSLLQAHRARHSTLAGETNWQQAESIFRESVARLNKRIRSYNLSVPSAKFQRMLIQVEREIAQVTSDHP
jgi:DnaJ homolog subfamily C member 28